MGMANGEKFYTGYIVRNRWKLIKKIGSGGFGTVYECVDLVTNHRVALKIELANKPLHMLRLKQEKDILEKLQDRDHFCSFFEYGVKHGHGVNVLDNHKYNELFYYLAMELQGENLFKLQKGKYSFVFPILKKVIFFFMSIFIFIFQSNPMVFSALPQL